MRQKPVNSDALFYQKFNMKSLKIRLSVLALVIFLFLVLGFIWWQQGKASVNPFNKTPKIFVVGKGEGVRTIASRLKKDNLIKDQVVFFLLIKKMGIDQNLQAGDFRLNQAMDAQTIAQTLTKGMVDIWVTFLEGWRSEEIALKMASDLQLPESQFLKYSQEGYMFPDTYLIPKEATAAAIVQILKDNFRQKVTEDLQKEAIKNGLTLKETIILASIVEKEASGENDRNLIAGILLRRLKSGWPLQADATLQYALGYQPEEKTWWKKNLTDFDKKFKSPYNTYLNIGLPPEPICNPGLASIRAVIYPEKSDFWYYLHDPTGDVHFARTIEEHETNIDKYLR